MSRNRQRTPLDSDVRLGIPAVTNDPDSLRRVAEALKLAVEQLARQRGALGRSAITVNDLLKLNIITPEAAAVLDPGGTTYDQQGVAGLTKAGSADGSVVSGGTSGGSVGTVSWGNIENKPLQFPPTTHGHDWSELANVPTEFPPLAHGHVWSEIADKPSTFPPTAHSHPWADIANKPLEFPPEPHTHDAADVISGQFADALIQESNVTQHEAALTIDWPQLTNLPDIVYQSGSQVITGNKTFNAAQYFGDNIEQTAGWFISSAGTRMGLGGLPNLTGSILQVYGSADIDGGSLNFRSGAAVNNVLYTGGLETMILRNFGTEPSTLLEIRSKAGNPLTDIREATLALTRTDDAGNAEFLDLYNNGYHTGSPASVQHGLRIQKRGTGEYRPFVFDWYDGTTYTPGFTADSVTGFDFSLDVAAPEFVEGGTSLAAKYAPIVHAHDDLYYTEAEIDEFLLNYNPVENGFVSRADTTISFVDGTRTFTITPTGASFEFWASGDRFVKSGPDSIVIPDIEGIHFIYYDDTGTLQVVQVFNLDIIATFCFVAAVYWDATNNVSIIFGDERHGRQMDSATHLWAHASFGSLYGNGFQPGNLSMDGNGNSAAHAQLSVSNGQFRDEDITHDITDGSPQELDPILQAPVLYRSGANGDWRKVAATSFPVTTAGSGRAAYNLFSGGVWSLAEAGNNNYVLIHLFATNDTRHPIVSIVGQNQYNNLGDARSAAPLELNELQFGGLASLLLEFIPIATFIVQTATGMTNAVKAAFRTTEEGDDFIDWREQRSVSGTGASSSNHSNLSGLGNDDHPQYHTDARGDARYSQLGHTHAIADVTGLQTALDGKEPDLGVPASDGYVLASTAAGVRSWVEMTGGAGGALGDLTDVTLTSPSVGQFLRYSGATWLNTALAAGDIPSLDAGKITTGIFLDARIPNLNTSKLTAGTLGVARGGTGISSFTALNYIRAAGATTLEQRTPAQVLSDIGAAAASHTHTIANITSLQTTLDDKVSISSTHLGRTGNFSFDSTTDTAAEWAALPVGYSRMFSSGIGTAGGAPVNNFGYFTKVANRDAGGGWGGLWVGYAAGQNYMGRALTSGDLATWDLLWSSANFSPSDYLPLAGGVMTGNIDFLNAVITDLNSVDAPFAGTRLFRSGFQPANRPSANYVSGIEWRHAVGGEYRSQLVMDTSGGRPRVYARNNTVGAWSSWETLADLSDLSGYLPLTGGTVSSRIILSSPDFTSHLRISRPSNTLWDISVSGTGLVFTPENDPSGSSNDRFVIDRSGRWVGPRDIDGGYDLGRVGNRFGALYLSNAITFGNNADLNAGGIGGLRITTPSGYIDFGPANTSHAHIYTDRPNFYFNKDLVVNGTTVSLVGHTHAAGDITSGTMATARLGSGTANSSTFLRGDNTWATPTASVATLGSIGDVVLTSIGTSEFLQWNGSVWINRTAAEAGLAALVHTHSASSITSGTMATARLGSGTANSSTFLRGDSTWASIDGAPPDTSFSLSYNLNENSTIDTYSVTLPSGWSLSETVPIWLNVVMNHGYTTRFTYARVPLFASQPTGSSASDGAHMIASGDYGSTAIRVRRFSATQYLVATWSASYGIHKIWFSRY